MLSGAAPIITGSAFTQTQVAQIFSLFNMNRPNDYDEFSQSFSVTKLDLKFLDGIELQSSLKDETRRNLVSTGYKDLSNVRIDTGSFLVNYIYWFVVVLLLAIFHGIIILLTKLKCIKEREESSKIKKTLKAIRKAFEFSVYFYIVMAASLFVWLIIINEIASGNFDTGLNGFSFFVSLFMLIFLFAVMLFPVLMVMLESRASKVSADTQDEVTAEEEKSVIAKLWANYQYGLRKVVPAQLFYTTMQLKYFLYAIIFILIDGKEAQISLFIILTFVYCGYYVIVMPFNYTIQNVVVISNECFILLIAFLFCGFLEDGDPDEDLATVIIVLFTINIVISFVLGFVFQIYLVTLKCKKNKEADSVLEQKPEPLKLEKDSADVQQESKRNIRNVTDQNLNDLEYNQDEEEDIPENESQILKKDSTMDVSTGVNDKYINAARAAMKKDNKVSTPDMKNTQEIAKDNDGDNVDAFEGNLKD